MIVPLDALKAHLNVTLNHDDALLSQKLDAAHAAVGNFIGKNLATEYSSYTPPVIDKDESGNDVVTTPAVESNAPAPIREAVLQFAAHLYEYREPMQLDDKAPAPPLGVFDLIGPYKTWSF